MQEDGQDNARVQAYIVSRHTSTGLDSANAMEPDHTPKIAMPMTAASVAQRRMGFKAPRAQKYEGQSPYLVSQGFSRGGVTNRIEREGPSSSGYSRGGIWPLCHRKMGESKQVRDDPSASQAPQNASGESSGR